MHRVSSQTIIGRDEPLRLLDDALASAEADGRGSWCSPARPAWERPGSCPRSRQRAESVASSPCTARAWSSAARSSRTRRSSPRCATCRRRGSRMRWPSSTRSARGARRAATTDTPIEPTRTPLLEPLRPGPAVRARARCCSGRLAADAAPVLVVLEDLHWADRSTRDFLAFLARNLRAERIAFALTYRTGELPPATRCGASLTEMCGGRSHAASTSARSTATRSRASWRRSPAAGAGAASRPSCTSGRAATRSSSRSCSPPARRRPGHGRGTVLARGTACRRRAAAPRGRRRRRRRAGARGARSGDGARRRPRAGAARGARRRPAGRGSRRWRRTAPRAHGRGGLRLARAGGAHRAPPRARPGDGGDRRTRRTARLPVASRGRVRRRACRLGRRRASTRRGCTRSRRRAATSSARSSCGTLAETHPARRSRRAAVPHGAGGPLLRRSRARRRARPPGPRGARRGGAGARGAAVRAAGRVRLLGRPSGARLLRAGARGCSRPAPSRNARDCWRRRATP